MTTSGLISAIHSLDLSKPENTRFQYGSSVLPRSIAAPMAGTCDDVTPAMILATFRSCFLATLRCRRARGFGFCRCFGGLLGNRPAGRRLLRRFLGGLLYQLSAVAFAREG